MIVKRTRPRLALAVIVCCTLLSFMTMNRSFCQALNNDMGAHRQLRRVLSFSLYGNSTRYSDGAIANSRLFTSVYHDWEMWVYHDHTVSDIILDKLRSSGVTLIDMSKSDLNPMNWRFLPASDESIDRFCSRDIDSRLSLREFAAVREWLDSRFKVHMIRDHPGHTGHPLMGGLWCASQDAVSWMREALMNHHRDAHFNADQEFLAEKVWPVVRNSTLHHVAFGCDKWENSREMPLPRVGLEHVGAVYIDGFLRAEDSETLKQAIFEGNECHGETFADLASSG